MSRWPSLDALVSNAGPAELDRDLRDFWENPAASSLRANRRIELEHHFPPPLPPETSHATLTLMEQPLEASWQGNQLWLPGLWADIWADHSHLVVAPEGTSQPALTLALTEVHRAGGWLPLHAAVVAKGGRAIAITGISGAGKSTATLRLAALGYEVVCEDRAFWHPVTDWITGLDRCLRAFPDSLERFAPHLLPGALPGPRDVKGKLMLPLQPTGGAKLERLLWLTSGREPMNAAEQVRLVWETTGVPLTDLARQQVQSGVTRLLPLLDPQPVVRSDVVERVRAILDS